MIKVNRISKVDKDITAIRINKLGHKRSMEIAVVDTLAKRSKVVIDLTTTTKAQAPISKSAVVIVEDWIKLIREVRDDTDVVTIIIVVMKSVPHV